LLLHISFEPACYFPNWEQRNAKVLETQTNA
jgi:hypothetical protein